MSCADSGIQAHLDGFSADGEWLQGWAHQAGQPITIWLHSLSALPPVPVLCDQPRPDLEALGSPEHCGFELAIASLPEAWHRPGLQLRVCSDQAGELPISGCTAPLQLPPLLHEDTSFAAMDQSDLCDAMPSRARQACQALRRFGGFYRHWYHHQRRQPAPGQVPMGWQPELIALCAGPVLKAPLGPFAAPCPTSWLQQLWHDPSAPAPFLPAADQPQSPELALASMLWGAAEPCWPEQLLASWRQHVIDAVLAAHPTVSVIIPTWNRRTSVLRAIDTALQQTVAPIEVLVADDGSSDGTLAAIEARFPAALLERTLRLLPGDHQGVSATRNRALAAARGEWFAYLDSDNAWHSDHLLLLLYSALHHPSSPTVLYSGRALYGPRVSGHRLPVLPFDYTQLQSGNFIDLNCLMHHRCLYDQHGGFNPRLKRLVDWDLALRYTAPAANSVVLPVTVCTVDYWRHPTILRNISTSEDWAAAREQVLALHNT